MERKLKKRLKYNKCPEFDCRSKQRTNLNDSILENVFKCDKCGRIYIPSCDPLKLWYLCYKIKNLITWKIPYRIKNFVSKEKQNKKYEKIKKDLKDYFNSSEGEAILEINNKKTQRESELKVGWFSPEEDEACGTVHDPCLKCINDCKYFYKIGRIGPDFREPYGHSCNEFVNLRGKKTVDFTLNKLIYNLKKI